MMINNKNIKKLFIVASIIILIFLLIPIRYVLKDGGTIVYQSLLYKITNYHRLDGMYESGYVVGIQIDFLGFTIYKNIKKDDTIINHKYTINTSKTKNCNGQPELYYKMLDKDIYTYCLDSIIIDNGNEQIELKDYLEKNSNALEEIINSLTKVEVYKDGGTIVYKDMMTSNFTKNGLTVVKCHRMLNDNSSNKDIYFNKDVYFGPSDTEFIADFCTTEKR